jgi:PQQ-like domain
LLLAIAFYAVLLAANIAPNPLPGIWEWLGEERPLAEGLAWQERLGSRAGTAAAAGDAVVVEAGNRAQIRDRDSGVLVGPRGDETWDAEWVVAAGDQDNPVVLIDRGGSDGYEVRDPASGALLHADEEAVAAWGYRDAWLDLRCDSQRACQLRSYRPGPPYEPVWAIELPGRREGTLGGNPPLAGARVPEPNRIHPQVSGPEPMPQLIGLPVSRGGDDVVVVVDTGSGRVLQEVLVADGERVIVVGNRVVRSTMARHGGVCVSQVTGYDPFTGDPVWGPSPLHLWSSDGVGCEQRTPPLAGGSVLTAVGTDGRSVIFDSYDGRVLWTGELDERVEDLSAERAVIRAADETTRYAVLLGGDGDRQWERVADPDAGVTLASCGVVVADREPNRIYVWDPVTGDNLLSLSTSARVLACAPDGVLIADGRSIGFARFDGATSDPEDSPDPPPLDSK